MTEIYWVLYSAGYLIFAVIFLLFAKKLFDVLTSYSVNTQLTAKDNPAVGLLLSGFMIGITAILCGVLTGDSPEEPNWANFSQDLVPILIYGVMGLIMLFLAGILNDKIVLRQFSNHKEIVDNQNSAVAVIMAATYIGSGIIIAGGISSSLDIKSAVLAFVIGQFAFILFGILYQVVTKYDDQEEIGKHKNLAAGIGFAGNLIAFSMILMRGLKVDIELVVTWNMADRCINALYYAIAGSALLVIVRFITDRVFLPRAKISEEIVRDRNLNAGYVEATLALSVGAILVVCL